MSARAATERATGRAARSIRWRAVVKRVVLDGVTLLLGLAFFLPFAWLVSSSLKTDIQIFVHPPQWIPSPWMWSNYPRALEFAPFTDYAVNSVRIALLSSLGAAISSALVAYGFARIQWPGRDAFFFVTLTTLMIPFQVTMVPTFLLFKLLGLAGTPWALIVPYWFGNAYFIFLLRQFLMTIPGELSEAARIDGASELAIFGRIVMPLARPGLAVVALFQFMHAWGDYLGPLIFRLFWLAPAAAGQAQPRTADRPSGALSARVSCARVRYPTAAIRPITCTSRVLACRG